MSAKAFIDTNVFAYFYSDNESNKQQCALSAVEKYTCMTSTQALNEFSSICTRKWKFPVADFNKAIDEICAACAVCGIDIGTIRQALGLHERYGYSYYDCLMLASALESGCQYLFSEDMSDGQTIEDQLEIVNIFKRPDFLITDSR